LLHVLGQKNFFHLVSTCPKDKFHSDFGGSKGKFSHQSYFSFISENRFCSLEKSFVIFGIEDHKMNSNMLSI